MIIYISRQLMPQLIGKLGNIFEVFCSGCNVLIQTFVSGNCPKRYNVER